MRMTWLPDTKPKNVTSLTIEHGLIKLLACRGLQVIDYRVVPVNPRFFREGQVSSGARVASVIQSVLPEINGNFRKVIAGVPGFEGRLRLLELPRAPGLDPQVLIPQEARRSMRVTSEIYHLTWQKRPDRLDRSRWLVLAASRRSVASLLDTTQRAGVKVQTLELRPFALARAVNQADGVVVWLAPDGCDVVILRESVPVEQQSLFWGAGLVEATVLIDRLTDIVGQTITSYEQSSNEGPLPEEVPLYVFGTPIGVEPGIGLQVAANLGRPAGELKIPLVHPADFPIHDLIVNIGLVLREV